VNAAGRAEHQAGRATPAQEAAFTIATGVNYREEVVDLGFEPHHCSERFILFFNVDEPL
jgi:methylmalonyl-CoA mutase N-terminal domain/subunit